MEIISQENNRFNFSRVIEEMEDGYFILCIDIIDFKRINDVHGYKIGDLVLKEIVTYIDNLGREGIAIKAYIYEKDTIFAVVKNRDKNEVTEIIQRIAFYKYASFEIQFRACYREVTCLEEATNFVENVNKIIRKEKYVIKDDEALTLDISRDIAIYTEIKQELLSNKERFFYLVYQPKVDIKTSEIASCEILSRWQHPILGPISPYEFIPIIKDLNKEYEFDLYVFEKSCRSLKDIKGIEQFSINISTNTLKIGDLPDQLNEITKRYNIDNKNITLEILEDNNMDDCKLININVDKLNDMGFNVSIDDFGTGYSSYYRLSTLDFSEVKIPREFLLLEYNNHKNKDVLYGIISLCKKLKCTIVSEGVETIKDYHLMKSLGVDYIQGYFYSKPLPKDEFIEFMVNYNGRLKKDGKTDIS